MKRITSLVLCAILAFSLFSGNGKAAMTQKDQLNMYALYADHIAGVCYEKYTFYDDDPYQGYVYFDLDNDGVMELIDDILTNKGDRTFEVYAVRDGKLKNICHFWGDNARLFVDPEQNRLLRLTVNGYHQILSSLAIENDDPQVTVLWDRTASAYNDYSALDTPVSYGDYSEILFPWYPTDTQKRYLQAVKAVIRQGDDEDRFFFCDMDGDGTNELIVEHTYIHPISDFLDSQTYTVYGYRNGSFSSYGEITVGLGQSGEQGVAHTDGKPGFIRFEATHRQRIFLRNETPVCEDLGYGSYISPYGYFYDRAIGRFDFYSIMRFSDEDLRIGEAPGTPYRLGDPSGDGLVTAEDARLALRQAVKLENFTVGGKAYTACDADRDGEVTASDARIILRVSVKLETLPDGVPTPKCGSNHRWNAGVVTAQASCGSPGEKTFTCSVCGARKTEEIGSTGAHQWDGGKVIRQPTKELTGVCMYTCTVCGEARTETLPKLSAESPALFNAVLNCVQTDGLRFDRITKTESISETTDSDIRFSAYAQALFTVTPDLKTEMESLFRNEHSESEEYTDPLRNSADFKGTQPLRYPYTVSAPTDADISNVRYDTVNSEELYTALPDAVTVYENGTKKTVSLAEIKRYVPAGRLLRLSCEVNEIRLDDSGSGSAFSQERRAALRTYVENITNSSFKEDGMSIAFQNISCADRGRITYYLLPETTDDEIRYIPAAAIYETEFKSEHLSTISMDLDTENGTKHMLDATQRWTINNTDTVYYFFRQAD